MQRSYMSMKDSARLPRIFVGRVSQNAPPGSASVRSLHYNRRGEAWPNRGRVIIGKMSLRVHDSERGNLVVRVFTACCPNHFLESYRRRTPISAHRKQCFLAKGVNSILDIHKQKMQAQQRFLS